MKVTRTPEEYGEIARLNQLRFERTADLLVLAAEDVPMFQAFLDGSMDEFNPEGLEQTGLVREIAIGKWRQERYWGIEGSLFEMAISDSKEAIDLEYSEIDSHTKIAESLMKQYGHMKAIELVTRLEARMRRIHEKARRDLDRLQAKCASEAKPERQKQNYTHEPKPTPVSIQKRPPAAPPAVLSPVKNRIRTDEPTETPALPETEPKEPKAA